MARMPKVYGQGAARKVGVAATHQDATPMLLRSAPSDSQYDTSSSAKIYSTSIPYGSYGSKVSSRLADTDETSISSVQATGWNDANMCYYDSENQIGAYAGYTFEDPVKVTRVKFWLNRYSGQNKTLPVKIQWMDASNDWHTIETVNITTNMDYPSYIFEIDYSSVESDIYGVRWFHDTEMKTGGNNVTFAGMTVYYTENSGDYTNPDLHRTIMTPDGAAGMQCSLSIHGTDSYRLIETVNDDPEIP